MKDKKESGEETEVGGGDVGTVNEEESGEKE